MIIQCHVTGQSAQRPHHVLGKLAECMFVEERPVCMRENVLAHRTTPVAYCGVINIPDM